MTRIENEWAYFDDKLGIRYPWYTSTALKIIDTWDFEGKRIFEYGVGYSTEWFRKRGANTWGVDYDLEWANRVGSMAKSNLREYVDSIEIALVWGMFDIVVIDGAWRDECTETAIKHLKHGGFLIIDNYKQKSADLEHWPLTEKIIEDYSYGIHKEPEHQDWQTLILVK